MYTHAKQVEIEFSPGQLESRVAGPFDGTDAMRGPVRGCATRTSELPSAVARATRTTARAEVGADRRRAGPSGSAIPMGGDGARDRSTTHADAIVSQRLRVTRH